METFSKDVTILYYTSNREEIKFEERIQQTLLKNCGNLPIISISQKPINLGTNICVGDVKPSGFNMFRQVLIGCKAAKTEFVISAESDCVYDKSYFEYRPKRNDICYRNSNLYLIPDHRSYWFKKSEGATHSQIIGRDFYIETLEKLFYGTPEWSAEEFNFPKERTGNDDVFLSNQIEYYKTENPVFQIKTHRSMRYYSHSSRIPVEELPYWGKCSDIRAYYFEGMKEVYSNQNIKELSSG